MRNRRICRLTALLMALVMLAGIADCSILTRTIAEEMELAASAVPADQEAEMEIVQDIPLEPATEQPTQEPAPDALLPEEEALPEPTAEPEPEVTPEPEPEITPEPEPEPEQEPSQMAVQAVSYSYALRISRDPLAELALPIIIDNEGSYSSVNANDNGALSVGKIQWHAGRALSLMRRIVAMNPEQALDILGEALYNEITSDSTSWSSRIVDGEEKALLSELLATSESKQAQDAQALDDVSGYLQRGRGKGIVSEGALIYFADIENQNGSGGSGRIARLATEYAGSAENVTLDIIHKIALEDEKVGRYEKRRNRTYNKIKALKLAEVAGPEDDSGSGSGSEEPPAEAGLHITGVKYPSTYVISNLGYTVKSGVISTDAQLTRLTIDIQDASGNSIASSLPKTWRLSGQQQSLSAYDSEIPFSKIRQEGSYTWIITAEDSAGRQAELRLAFKAVSSGSTAVGNGSASSKQEPEEIKVSKIELSSTSLSMLVGEEATLTARLSPEDAQDKHLRWSSSNEAVATVKNGAVTAVSAGEAVILCTSADGGAQAQCSVLVQEPAQLPESMEIVVPEGCLGLGESVALKVRFQPEGSQAKLKWSVANGKLVSVDEDGVVTGKKLGVTTITVRSENGLKDSLKVKVVDPNVVAAVILEESGTITLNLGQTLQLHAELSPSTAQSTLKWSSKASKYASVDQSGLVTAHAVGSTTITVKSANGKKDTLKIKVVDPTQASSIALDKSGTVTLNLGDSLQLSAAMQPATARNQIKWGSSNTKVAQIDQNGLVTARRIGTATVAVKTDNGKLDSLKLKVVDPDRATKVVLSHSGTVSIKLGAELQLSAEVLPATAETSLEWGSSNAKIAHVDQNGLVTGLKKGTVTVAVRTANGKKDSVKIRVK